MQDIKVVAICYTQDKKVKYVSLVKNVSPLEYEKLCQDMLDYESEKDRVIADLNKKLENLGHKVESLENDIKTLKGID